MVCSIARYGFIIEVCNHTYIHIGFEFVSKQGIEPGFKPMGFSIRGGETLRGTVKKRIFYVFIIGGIVVPDACVKRKIPFLCGVANTSTQVFA